jgi:hypothetical protein
MAFPYLPRRRLRIVAACIFDLSAVRASSIFLFISAHSLSEFFYYLPVPTFYRLLFDLRNAGEETVRIQDWSKSFYLCV